jgi:hypothetical protein
MIHHKNQVVELVDQVHYGFDDKGPYQSFQHANSYWRQEYVDPAPCYHHDPELVQKELEHLQQVAPLPIPLKIAILTHETLSRTNGWYMTEYDYNGKVDSTGSYPRIGMIVLSGKRIPLHPAMTRYLVAHEYGHAIQYQMEHMNGLKSDQMEPGYTEHIRPDAKTGYGPGKWHANIGELIANDFRILIAEREKEFWPHPGYARPETIPACIEFWNDAKCMLNNWANEWFVDGPFNKIFKFIKDDVAATN